jgi:hypothetical protein
MVHLLSFDILNFERLLVQTECHVDGVVKTYYLGIGGSRFRRRVWVCISTCHSIILGWPIA